MLETGRQSSARYPGAMLCWHLNTWTHSLHRIRSAMLSQCRTCCQNINSFIVTVAHASAFHWCSYCSSLTPMNYVELCWMLPLDRCCRAISVQWCPCDFLLCLWDCKQLSEELTWDHAANESPQRVTGSHLTIHSLMKYYMYISLTITHWPGLS